MLQGVGGNDATRRAAALSDLEKSIRYEKAGDRVQALDYTNRGLLFYRDERFEDALAESKTAIEIAPDRVDAHVLQVQSLLKLRRFDEVIRSCDAAIAKGKKSAVLYELRGLAQCRPSRLPGRDSRLRRSPRDPAHDAEVLAHRGWAYLFFDSPRLALADFDAAIKSILLTAMPIPAGASPRASRRTRGRRGRRPRSHRGATARIPGSTTMRRGSTRSQPRPPPRRLGEKGRQARQLVVKYEDTALQLIRQAFEHESPEKRAAFWRDTVQPDPALKRSDGGSSLKI